MGFRNIVEGWIRNEGLPDTPDRGRLLFDRLQVAEWAAKRGLAARAGFLAPRQSALGTNLRLGPLLRAGGIWRDVPAAEVPGVFERVVTALPGATPPVRQLLGQRVRAKGGVTMAPVGERFRPAASQRPHYVGPRLRHGGVVVAARRAAAGNDGSRWRAGTRLCFLHRALAARAP